MWRYLAGGGAGVAAAAAGMMAWSARDAAPAQVLPQPPVQLAPGIEDPLPMRVPEATAKTREEKRFGRYDKDRDGRITRDEYLASRRKAYAKLDTNGDGQLSFDEWAAKTSGKFAAADRDKSGVMSAAEFATTAVKRKPAPRQSPCPPPASQAEEG